MTAGPNSSNYPGYLTPITPLPLDDETLHRRISNLIAGVTGLPGNLVRPRWQPNPPPIPAPDVDWVAVGTTAYPAIGGTPHRLHIPDVDGVDKMDDSGGVKLLASFYGPNCGAYARLCRSGLWVEQNWEQLGPLGVSLTDATEITLTGEEVNETWYRRADLPIILSQSINRTYDIRNILRATGVIHSQHDSENTVDVDFDTENVEDDG